MPTDDDICGHPPFAVKNLLQQCRLDETPLPTRNVYRSVGANQHVGVKTAYEGGVMLADFHRVRARRNII